MKSWSRSIRGGRVLLAASAVLSASMAFAQQSIDDPELLLEAYIEVAMPAQFHVEATLLDGPVFADANGKTLYKWPQHLLRNGYSGEAADTPECYDEVITVTAGLMSPYPAGIRLPDFATRPSCVDLWPPVLAEGDGEELEIGKWTIVERRDGKKQWAYDEQPLYTSVRDTWPGDVLGGTTRRYGGDSPAMRVPIKPPPKIPPGFAIKSTALGRMLTTNRNESVYSFDADTASTSACDESCLRYWHPVVAPALARPQDEWSIFERSAGVRQWTFRGKPLYTHELDQESWSQEGSDVPGWHNVFTQRAPAYPESFTVQAGIVGEVLADAEGRTIYRYNCGEDSADQLACDHPNDTQVYRIAMCGGGDPEKCLSHWPYVRARDDEVSANDIWRIQLIDPLTGHLAEEGRPNAIRVWSYRDRPVYTFGGDKRPGDVHGGGTGEWRGQRNGLKAFWLRDDFMGGIL